MKLYFRSGMFPRGLHYLFLILSQDFATAPTLASFYLTTIKTGIVPEILCITYNENHSALTTEARRLSATIRKTDQIRVIIY